MPRPYGTLARYCSVRPLVGVCGAGLVQRPFCFDAQTLARFGSLTLIIASPFPRNLGVNTWLPLSHWSVL